ncbi:MAG: sensor histidine kinase [Acidobacteriota bacterium]
MTTSDEQPGRKPPSEGNETRACKQVEDIVHRSERLIFIGAAAAGLAHEINNPLGTILMAARYALASKSEPDAQQIFEKAIRDIATEAQRCCTLARSISRFANQLPPEKSPCSLGDIARLAIKLTRRDAADRATISYLEPPTPAPEVLACNTEMGLAIACIIRYAIDSAHEHARLTIQASTSGERARLTVKDNGEGIPEEQMTDLFDPHYSPCRGIGLSLAHAIVTDHGGAIEVSSSCAAGTTFTIELPLARPESQRL